MAEYGRGTAAPSFLPPPHQGDANRRELQLVPNSLPSLPAAPAGVSALGPFRRKLPARRGPPPQASTATQLLHESDCKPPLRGVCLSPTAPSQWATPRPSQSFPHLGLAQEYPAKEAGSQWLCLPSATLCPLGQQPKDFASSGGDSPLAQWGFLPSGIVWMSAQLDPERGAQPALCWPPNICILTLAMMIAGIPTVPVPGVREEDMILAAQNFMAGSLPPGGVEGEGPPRSRWAAAPYLGLTCMRDQQQRKRPAGRSLLPLFLAQRKE